MSNNKNENLEDVDFMSKLVYSAVKAACGDDKEKHKKIIDLIEKDLDFVNFTTAFGILACEEQKKVCAQFFPEDEKELSLQASRNVLIQS